MSRPELTMAQDTDDILEKIARGSGSYRVSSSTGRIIVYGTTQYILKFAIKQDKNIME